MYFNVDLLDYPTLYFTQAGTAIVKDGRPLEKYPAASPILALQTYRHFPNIICCTYICLICREALRGMKKVCVAGFLTI